MSTKQLCSLPQEGLLSETLSLHHFPLCPVSLISLLLGIWKPSTGDHATWRPWKWGPDAIQRKPCTQGLLRRPGVHSSKLLDAAYASSMEGNPAGLSRCSGGLRPLVELCVHNFHPPRSRAWLRGGRAQLLAPSGPSLQTLSMTQMALRLLRLPRQQGLDMAGHSPSLVPGPPQLTCWPKPG